MYLEFRYTHPCTVCATGNLENDNSFLIWYVFALLSYFYTPIKIIYGINIFLIHKLLCKIYKNLKQFCFLNETFCAVCIIQSDSKTYGQTLDDCWRHNFEKKM
jgi:hypothetical protein